MYKKEKSIMLTVGLTTSILLNYFTENIKNISAQELKNKYENTCSNILTDSVKDKKSIDTVFKEQIYLSDIEYDRNKSSAGWGSIKKDTNPNGGTIKLLVDGEAIEFKKGMGAHATSTLVYDVSDYIDTYTRFVSYVGIDNSQGSQGNGAIFKIYTSKDGERWDLAKNIGLLKGDKESAYVDIPLKGVKYIKLYADSNGHNGNDHAVYADAKLVKDDYTISSVEIEGLETLETYDSILRANSIEENIANNELIILRRAFVKRLGYESLQRLANQGEKYVNGITYLINDIDALRYFITGGPVNIGGSYQKSLRAFCDIYSKYKDELKDTSDDNFNLRLAVSISLAYSRSEMVRFWISGEKEVSAVNRYEVYKALVSSGKMDDGGNTNDYGKWSSENFKKLPIPLMKWTVDARLNDDEIFWLADYALSMKKQGRKYLDAYNYITYTSGYNYTKDKYYAEENHAKYNDKYHFDKYYNNYGDKNVQRLWMIFEEGSVCGGLAQTYAALSDTFGRPSSPCGQPGHAVSLTYGWNNTNNRYEWMIQNDISGWVETGNQYDDRMLGWGNQSFTKWTNASYTVLATDAVNDSKNFEKATMLNLLADSYTDNNTKKEIYLKALYHQKINLDAMEGLINCYKEDKSIKSTDYFKLGKTIIETYTYYPQTMMELLALIEDNITDTNEVAQLDLLKHNSLVKASKATAKESTNVTMSKQLANHYLENETSELATFSFDGENATKIVINSKYDDSQIRIRYSLDGGTTWAQTDEHTITLTEEELSSITAENDIKVGLVGTNDFYTIDILPGNTISSSTIYANDSENLLVGSIDNLEFSIDNGQTWCDYVANTNSLSRSNPNNVYGIRFEGNKTVKVRYKAHGLHLQSNEYEYNFTEDRDTDTRKYVQLKNVTLEDYTSQQDNISRAAKNFIDGNANTAWHTTFNKFAENKFYTVSFDKVRYITSLEYLPEGANGRLKNGEIYTSLDGNNWTLSGSFKNLANNTSVKVLNLDKPTPCKYVKLVATNTYGNTTGELDMYFSGKMLSFYEDSTKEYISKPVVKYSNTNPTNEDVTSTITLPDGCSIIGEDTYVFSSNGTHTFKYIDASGVEQSIDAVVNWIDKECPSADVNYSCTQATNGDVTVILNNISSDAKVINNKGNTTYTFTKNGSFEFIIEDKVGNRTTIPVAVHWIDKESPIVDVSYSEENKTNKDVIVTLNGLKDGEYVVNNDGKTQYIFKENGIFEFIIKDAVGNTTTVPVSVNWIDKEAPTADIVYDITSWTSEDVTVKLTNISEDVTILNDGLDYYTFKDNGEFTFKFLDKAGNIGTSTAKVTWIDKTKPQEVVNYDNLEETSKPVTVSLNVNPDEVEILNNNGKSEYTFDENGCFVFKLRLKNTGYEFEVPITVDYINEDLIDDSTTLEDTDDNSNDNNLSTGSNLNNNDNAGNIENQTNNNNTESKENNLNNNDNNNLNNNDNNNLENSLIEIPKTGEESLFASLANIGLSLLGIILVNRKMRK